MGEVATRQMLDRALSARREGRADEARSILQEVLRADPDCGPALNSLGLIELGQGNAAGAVSLLMRAVTVDPKAPPLWLNLADAYRTAGDGEAELRALDKALALDPYMLAALLRKAQALERMERVGESIAIYRSLLNAAPSTLPDAMKAALDHGREVIAAEGARKRAALEPVLEPIFAAHADADLTRARVYLDNVAGGRKVYKQEPTGSHFPFLPAIEFFDLSLFPWFSELEAATDDLRAEFIALQRSAGSTLEPYVTFDATTPVNQWRELNHSLRWSAGFLWRNGEPHEENLARCPKTAALLDRLPLLDIPDKSPTVMFSVLAPHTRIPPHTGTSNVRCTIHLPLIVPDGCGLRVGGDTREWRVGDAWAFDDTIEHEAWNDSEFARVILILDGWNPLLSEAERAIVRAAGG